MARKCFISFKTEDLSYKEQIQDSHLIDIVDKSLDTPINSNNEEYIMRKIREDYLCDSTVTIHLIGHRSAEILGEWEQRYIKRELQASLYNGPGNTRNGLLGVVLPLVHSQVYRGSYTCQSCGISHNWVAVNDNTTVREFHCNYYIPNSKCSHSEDDRYCVLVPWNDFMSAPNDYIERAFTKRTHPIANQVRVYP